MQKEMHSNAKKFRNAEMINKKTETEMHKEFKKKYRKKKERQNQNENARQKI